uniref:protein-serine/threonine phosphatase n=1 Tax=Corethron hystrix TaxID=216773 RepID=A0A7S1B877_9STRA|mmetsp:Transcript_15157/g.33901  ORF Transcript_15157/g.33901 Transcript_15157/m.33901 type:complete len:836 (+) Transcript_15157:277-2784(+)
MFAFDSFQRFCSFGFVPVDISTYDRRHRKIANAGYLYQRCRIKTKSAPLLPAQNSPSPPPSLSPFPSLSGTAAPRSNKILTFPSASFTVVDDMVPRSSPSVVPPVSPSPPSMSRTMSVDSGGIGAALEDFIAKGSSPSPRVEDIDENDDENYDVYTWIRRYCVLEEGVLYFYVDEAVAHSNDAKDERMTAEEEHDHSAVAMCEMRIPIRHVSCVRSKEKLGAHSFVLTTLFPDGLNEDTEENLVVLRASDGHDMNTWLFQFHQSIANLVAVMMESVATTGPHSRALETLPRKITGGTEGSERPNSLSHGHGRHGLHRLRLRAGSTSSKPSSLRSTDALHFEAEISDSPVTVEPVVAKVSHAYVPPHLRKRLIPIPPPPEADSVSEQKGDASTVCTVEEDFFSLEESCELLPQSHTPPLRRDSPTPAVSPVVLGGCAAVERFHHSSSKFGSAGGLAGGDLKWEVGAVSERGVRNTNEDSYVVISDYPRARGGVNPGMGPGALFAIFDGHCGQQTAQYAAKNLAQEVGNMLDRIGGNKEDTERCLRDALAKIDRDFCQLCTADGNDWDCGATALVAAVVEEGVVVANLGDCRGVMARSMVGMPEEGAGWNVVGNKEEDNNGPQTFWREVTDVHSADREDERDRIMGGNGWLLTDRENCISQLQRLDLYDEDVRDIIRRCFAERVWEESHAIPGRQIKIVRVCGELAVSRALGDKDFKSSYNEQVNVGDRAGYWWMGPDYLLYPKNHNRAFVGDLVSATPEFQTLSLEKDGTSEEFLLLACDGLWDVMDMEDAVRVSHTLLFEKGFSAKDAAARVAELAIHLGSSDNVTVILIHFFRE